MDPAPPTLLEELQRRRVFRALVGYGVVAFTLLQIAEPIMHGLHWPDAVLTWLVVGLAVGFPLVVGLAWIFDVNQGRIERTGPSARLRGAPLVALLIGIGAIAATPDVAWYFFVRRPAQGMAAPGGAEAPAQAEAPAATDKSIAVLPFQNLSDDKDGRAAPRRSTSRARTTSCAASARPWAWPTCSRARCASRATRSGSPRS